MSLKPLASGDIADARGEEADPGEEQDEVEHGTPFGSGVCLGRANVGSRGI
jgi:hypothetical protein